MTNIYLSLYLVFFSSGWVRVCAPLFSLSPPKSIFHSFFRLIFQAENFNNLCAAQAAVVSLGNSLKCVRVSFIEYKFLCFVLKSLTFIRIYDTCYFPADRGKITAHTHTIFRKNCNVSPAMTSDTNKIKFMTTFASFNRLRVANVLCFG